MKMNMKKMRKMRKEKPKNLPDTMKCQKCEYTMPVPKHCRAPMHIEDKLLVCWMGKECGQKEIPLHCDVPMEIISISNL